MSRRHDWVVEQEVSVLLSVGSQDETLRVERPVSHSSIKKLEIPREHVMQRSAR